MQSKTRLVSIIVGSSIAVAFILYVVSNALPEWSKISDGSNNTSKFGLWQACLSIIGVTVCSDIKCPEADGNTSFCRKVLTGRAFMTLACILSGICAICLIVYAAVSDKVPNIVLIASKVLAFITLIMGIIGVGVGGSISQTLNETFGRYSLGASAIVGIIAVIINLGGAIASLFIQ
ncbi:unnamed protein product [Adineta ricciae]|uniref:Uncharacterized protein n=1 Tax=Adineta ricciae TaxID=249248 RepID=A0A815Q6Q1_ADIRI|nr:unnamed protein product [Adineta ricciae]CAF1458351.1 unnamed protein product [Adineta ricciae]